jgi:hypothetical protein
MLITVFVGYLEGNVLPGGAGTQPPRPVDRDHEWTDLLK